MRGVGESRVPSGVGSIQQMYVNGDEAEVGSGSQRALGCRPE